MLAIDGARTSGLRDPLYYALPTKSIGIQVNALQPEKEYLIEAGKLGAHMKTRRVTLIATCSEFKLHGSKMVVGVHINTSSICMVILIFRIIDGKWVEDDYYEDKVLHQKASMLVTSWVTSWVTSLTPRCTQRQLLFNKESNRVVWALSIVFSVPNKNTNPPRASSWTHKHHKHTLPDIII